MEFFLWLAYTVAVIGAWEYFGYSLDWHEGFQAWKVWGDQKPTLLGFSYRFGPAEIYRF